MLERTIHPEEALAIKLNDIIHLQLRHVRIGQRLSPDLRLRVDEVLKFVLLAQLVLGDEVVEVDQLDGHQVLRRAEPRDLLGRLLDVALQVQLQLDARDGRLVLEQVDRVERVRHLPHDGVAPVHQRDFLVLRKGLRVLLVDDDLAAIEDLLRADILVLGVERFLLEWSAI